jgi:thioredoxin-dependent peroxiredoxin
MTSTARRAIGMGGNLVAALALLMMLNACGAVRRPDGGAGLLPVGAAAPDFEGRDVTGKSVHLSDVRGHFAVVYFYPKDETPGCTHEACAFRDAFTRFEARKIAVFGISRDSNESHKEFRSKNSLPFTLVADEDGSVDRAYGVPSMLGMSKRVTFLIGVDGKVSHIWPDVDPAVHAEQVLGAASP